MFEELPLSLCRSYIPGYHQVRKQWLRSNLDLLYFTRGSVSKWLWRIQTNNITKGLLCKGKRWVSVNLILRIFTSWTATLNNFPLPYNLCNLQSGISQQNAKFIHKKNLVHQMKARVDNKSSISYSNFPCNPHMLSVILNLIKLFSESVRVFSYLAKAWSLTAM